MKYTTKQLISMPKAEILEKCDGNCETARCLFKKSLRECREDGFCVAQTFRKIDLWIAEDEQEIASLQLSIKLIRARIAKYKRWKKRIQKEIEDET